MDKILIRVNDKKILITIMVISIFIFNTNMIAKISVTIFILIIASLLLKLENIFYIYIALFFFEEVMKLPKISMSIAIVLQPIIVLKIMYMAYKNKFKFNKSDIYIGGFTIISIFISIISKQFSTGDISFGINIFVLLCCKIYLYNEENRRQIINNLFKVIVIAVVLSIIHGVVFSNFLIDERKGIIVYRFKGTYEPNFLAMYINLAISILLYDIVEFKNKYAYIAIFIVLFIGQIFTFSMTGYLILSVLLIIFAINEIKTNGRKRIFELASYILIAIVLSGLIQFTINIVNKSPEYKTNITQQKDNGNEERGIVAENPVEAKVKERVNLLKENKLNEMTSGRLGLFLDAFNDSINRPIGNMIFGNGPTAKMHYSSFFWRNKYSHNTYVDILNSFGIVGLIIILIYFYKKLISKEFIYDGLPGNKSNFIFGLRLVIFMHAFTLSISTNRLFLLFLLL